MKDMEDQQTLQEIIHQIKSIEKNNWNTMDYLTSIDLLLTSDNNGTTKDAEISHDFSTLKKKLEEVSTSTETFLSKLQQKSNS